jgi:hypothetical protein
MYVHTDLIIHTFYRLQNHRVTTLVAVYGGLSCSVPLHKRRIYFPCKQSLSYLLFSERQNPRDSPEISTELVTPDIGNGNDSEDSSHDPIFTYNAFHNVNLFDCFVHFPSRNTYG